jgi:hypothetical protein
VQNPKATVTSETVMPNDHFDPEKTLPPVPKTPRPEPRPRPPAAWGDYKFSRTALTVTHRPIGGFAVRLTGELDAAYFQLDEVVAERLATSLADELTRSYPTRFGPRANYFDPPDLPNAPVPTGAPTVVVSSNDLADLRVSKRLNDDRVEVWLETPRTEVSLSLDFAVAMKLHAALNTRDLHHRAG